MNSTRPHEPRDGDDAMSEPERATADPAAEQGASPERATADPPPERAATDPAAEQGATPERATTDDAGAPVGAAGTGRSGRVPWPAVAVFVLAACALAWLVALPLWIGGAGGLALGGLLVPAMMFTPGLATLLVLFLLRVPRRGRLAFLGIWPLRPALRRIGTTALAIVGVPLLVVLSVLVAAGLGLVQLDLVHFSGYAETLRAQLATAGLDATQQPPAGMLVGVQLLIVPLAALFNGIFAFGEEVGWRGWLLTALRPLGVWPSLLVTGVIWGLWHTPIILLGHNFGRTDVTGVLLMVAGCVTWGVLFGWLRLRTGSVWPAVFGHGALNAAGGLVLLVHAAGAAPDLALAGPFGVAGWIVLAVVVAVLALCGQFRRGVLEPPHPVAGD